MSFDLNQKLDELKESMIVCGDSLEKMRLLPDKSIHLVFTSPPYAGLLREYVDDPRDLGKLQPDEYIEQFMHYVHEVDRILRHEDGSVFVLNLGEKYINGYASCYIEELMLRIRRETPLKVIDKVPWIKLDPMVGKKSRHGTIAWEHVIIFGSNVDKLNKNNDYLRMPYRSEKLNIANRRDVKEIRKQTGHPMNDARCYNNIGAEPLNYVVCATQGMKGSNHKAQMPKALAEYFIGGYSQEGQFVLDPFAGGGTTPAVAHMMRRKYVAIDLSPENCGNIEQTINDTKQYQQNLFNYFGLIKDKGSELENAKKEMFVEHQQIF